MMKRSYIVLLFMLALAGCFHPVAVKNQAGVEGKPNLSTPGFLIDSHIHYRPTDAWERSFVEVFEKWNAIGCVLVSMNDLERGMAFAKAHPRRVIPYAAIDIDSPTVAQDIQKVYDLGFKGLGELFALNQWDYEDPKYDVIWAMAEKLRLPVAPHTGIHASGKMSRMRPGPLGAVAAKYPKLMVHSAHFGNPWYDEAGEIARRNANVYFDMSGSSLIKKDRDPRYWLQILWWTDYLGAPHMPKGAVPAFEKIVFASDEGPEALEANIIRFNKMLDACQVPDAIRRKCYYETIAKMHGIDLSKYLK